MRVHLSSIGLLWLTISVSGCVFPWTAMELERRPCGGRVVLVRGLGGYFLGAERLNHRLRCQGVDSMVIFGAESHGTSCALADEAGIDGQGGPLVIVGYSLGANDAIKMCRRLDRDGVFVDRLILIDTPYHDTIPPNVGRCLNVYRSRPHTDWIPMFRGLPLAAEDCGTDLENLDTRDGDLGCAPLSHNHLTICYSDAVQDVIVDEVLAAQEDLTNPPLPAACPGFGGPEHEINWHVE